MTKLAACGDIPRWNGTVDSGWPVIIETISSGLTNPIRLAYLYTTGCMQLNLAPALFLFKAQILLMWLVLAAGTYVLGRTLFRHRLAAVFLFAAVLFAGVGLDDLHSDQDGVILFWLPWILTCAVQAHRHRNDRLGAVYFTATVLFLSLQAFDHYPHFPLVIATTGAVLYALLYRQACWQFLRSQVRHLWPAAIIVLLTAVQFWVFSHAISGFVPSQRGDLIVDLSQNGESGWVQPSVLLTAFLPLTTLAGFEYLASSLHSWLTSHGGPDQTLFIFRLNSLIYYVGLLPTVFCAAFAVLPGRTRVKIWWFAFTAIIFAISVQETHISYAMFYLPFFNVFRTYSLFGLFVAFGVLVMSGYGVDGFLSLGLAARAALVRRGLVIVALATLISGACIGAILLAHPGPIPSDVRGDISQGVAADLLVLAGGAAAVWLASRSAHPGRWIIGLTALTIASQVGFAEGSYHFVAMRSPGVLGGYKLDADDYGPPPARQVSDPNTFRRKTCDQFAVCYLSRRDTVSLRLDGDGTFLRNSDEPVFQPDLATDVIKALDGVTHPVFWFSSTVDSYATPQELVDDLNAHQHDIGDYLDQVTHVPVSEASALDLPDPDLAAPVDAHLVSLVRRRDVVQLSYKSTTPAYLNVAMNYDPAWTVTINGNQVQPLLANFNDMLVPVPAGDGDIVLRYRSASSDFFFYSRYILVAAAVSLAIGLAVSVWRRARWVVLGTSSS